MCVMCMYIGVFVCVYVCGVCVCDVFVYMGCVCVRCGAGELSSSSEAIYLGFLDSISH